ncbi:MAG TPA: hypothetical protein VKU89_10080 [Solirubrobacteraceae bacterium]|nr:hypothetical protein [Solirubrobacteraceae bacterium]
MSIRRALAAIYEFVVGDDPFSALGVVVALGLTAALAAAKASAWPVLPLAVVLLLALSLRRERLRRRSGPARAAALRRES